MDVQVIGLCRFSVLCKGGFKKAHDWPERKRMLYETGRLERRFAWFEHLCLPSVRAQTDPDFTLIVLTGLDLPEWAMARLRALIADVPQVRLRVVAPGFHKPLCLEAFRSVRDPAARRVAEFWLDDDDAVGRDFVASLRVEVARLPEDQPLPSAVQFPQGYFLSLEAGTPRVLAVERYGVAAGSAVVFAPDASKCVMHFPHHRLREEMPCTVVKSAPMFVRGVHPENDSVVRVDQARFWPAPSEVFATRFGVDLAAFASAVAAAPAPPAQLDNSEA
ncbi:MAG: glycosyltransferase [Pseudomonadota bacterium]